MRLVYKPDSWLGAWGVACDGLSRWLLVGAKLRKRGEEELQKFHDSSLEALRMAAGGTSGTNHRTHTGRHDPECTMQADLHGAGAEPSALGPGAGATLSIDGLWVKRVEISDGVTARQEIVQRLREFDRYAQFTASKYIYRWPIRTSDETGCALARACRSKTDTVMDMFGTTEEDRAFAHDWVVSEPT